MNHHPGKKLMIFSPGWHRVAQASFMQKPLFYEDLSKFRPRARFFSVATFIFPFKSPPASPIDELFDGKV
jgi:hypothetical protein